MGKREPLDVILARQPSTVFHKIALHIAGERDGLDLLGALEEGAAGALLAGAFIMAGGSLFNSCFAAGTPLLTPSGARPIERIGVGELTFIEAIR